MGRDKSHEHWVSVIRQLIHLGLVTQNIASILPYNSQRPRARAARRILAVAVPRIWRSNRKRCRNRSAATMIRLFAKLRKLRKSIADESNVPPYVVFNDATLIEMAEQMPITASEMLSVNALGCASWNALGTGLWR